MKHFATVMLGFGILLAALPTARAADTTCPPNPSPGSTVNGNLTVTPPTGLGCYLVGVTVTGNVQVQPNSFLEVVVGGSAGALIPSKIEGNLTLGSGSDLTLEGYPTGATTIGGNVTGYHCEIVQITSGNAQSPLPTRLSSLAAMSSSSIATPKSAPIIQKLAVIHI